MNAVNRRPRAPAAAPESREPRRGRTEEQAVLVTFAKTKVTRRKGEKVTQPRCKLDKHAKRTLVSCLRNKLFHFDGTCGCPTALPLLAIARL